MFHLTFQYTGLIGVSTVSCLTADLRLLNDTTKAANCRAHAMEVKLHSVLTDTYARPLRTFGMEFASVDRKTNFCSTESGVSTTVTLLLVISAIEPGSPADRCGVLQVGDRVRRINGWQGSSVEEAHYVLRQSETACLNIEFDVMEPLLSASRIVVKLARQGASSYGIVFCSQTNNHLGEPLIVSDIRTGSVAHRCGSIAIGDRITAINGASLDELSVKEAVRLLQQSANVVKLCIAKAHVRTPQASSTAINNSIVFAVELQLDGQPLGITVATEAQSDDSNNSAIVVSQIIAGGLAARTGTLRVGDRILAINDVTLAGKNLVTAIQELHRCPQATRLRIERRNLSYNNDRFFESIIHSPIVSVISEKHENGSATIESLSDDGSFSKTQLKSVDSAVNSLDDAVTIPIRQLVEPVCQTDDPVVMSCRNYHNVIMSTVSEPDLSGGAAATNAAAPCDSGLSSATEGPANCDLPNSIGSEALQTSSNNARVEEFKENWIQILETLEIVGETEMLQRLEECIMNGMIADSQTNSTNRNGILERTVATAIIDGTAINGSNYEWEKYLVPPSRQMRSLSSTPLFKDLIGPEKYDQETERDNRHDLHDLPTSTVLELPQPMFPLSSVSSGGDEQQHVKYIVETYNLNLSDWPSTLVNDRTKPNKVFNVSLNKDLTTRSFGFSISDGVSSSFGIYVNSVISGSPADGLLRPMDRVLQINNTNVQFLDCDLALPLLASDHVDLLLLRKYEKPKPNKLIKYF